MNITQSFAKTLKHKRQQSGLSQEKLAELANLSMRSISLLECSKQQPTLATIEKLAKVFKLTASQLLVEVENY